VKQSEIQSESQSESENQSVSEIQSVSAMNSVIKESLHIALIDKKLILSFFVHIFVLINVHKRKQLCLQPVFPISEKTLNGI
jgi:hypothetical protein